MERSPFDEMPESVLREAKAELDAESRTGVERLARATCVVASWVIGEMLKTMHPKAKK